MSRRLVILNVFLAIVSIAFGVGIVSTFGRTGGRAAPTTPPAVIGRSSLTSPGRDDPEQSGYAVIAIRNLFSPTRGESVAAPATADAAKVILHGVVVAGTKSRAFLEDPAGGHVAGYSLGDPVGGGRLQQILEERVLIARPEGLLEILLRDPSKPRPIRVAAPPAPQGQVAVTPGPGQPGSPPEPAGQSSISAAAAVAPTNQSAIPGSPPQLRRRQE